LTAKTSPSHISAATQKDRHSVNPESTTIGKIVQAEGIWVTFSYKERNRCPVRLSVPVERFIELLIQHILPNNFRQIRYYGILANRIKTSLKKIFLKLLKRKKHFLEVFPWRERQKLYRGYDPLLCPKCGKQMKLAEIFYLLSKSKLVNPFPTTII